MLLAIEREKERLFMNIKSFFAPLSSDHQTALTWFLENTGKDDVPFTPESNGIRIVSPAQGIFKPATSEYTYSVKETMVGAYPDQKPVLLNNGSWLYAYHQQGDNSKLDRDKWSSNRALVKNINDKVPVGVWIQTQSKGRKGAQYKIGIALPVGWVEGFFILIGASDEGEIPEDVLNKSPEELYTFVLKKNQEEMTESQGYFDPKSVVDERKKALKSIVQRQGQPAFRKKVLNAYESQCPISGCDVREALEAAHISPYMGPITNSVQNGFPLRADIHTLWDLGLICVDSRDMKILVHPKLHSTAYGLFHDTTLILPNEVDNHPSTAALDEHREYCGF
jgi:putative restriction endonuclease